MPHKLTRSIKLLCINQLGLISLHFMSPGGSISLLYVWQLYFVKNYKNANNVRTVEAREKISTALKSHRFLNVGFAKCKDIKTVLNKNLLFHVAGD
jgi:hypothetical protein